MALGGSLAVVVGVGWFVLHVRGISIIPRGSSERPLLILGPSQIVGLDEKGKKVVEIYVKGATVTRAGVYNLWGIDPAIWYREDEGVVMASAGRGTYNERTRNAEISGGLKVSSRDGFALEAEELRWEYGPREIICPGRLTIHHRNFSGETDFAKYLIREQKLVCPNTVRAEIAKHITLTGESLVIDGKTQELSLEKVAGTVDFTALQKAG